MRAYLQLMRVYALILACTWCASPPSPAYADPVPADDISAGEPLPNASSPAQPAARAEIEAFIRAHTARVPAEDIDGYLSDFVEGHPTIPVLRAHLTRAFTDFNFSVELEAITVLKVLKLVSTAKVIQRTERTTAAGVTLTERAELHYFLRRPTPSSPWRVEHTTRKRLDDAPLP
jgi:hypothetical protein